MAVVNVGTAITKAVTKLTGSLPRAQFVTWFNEIVKDILAQPREWFFLQEPVSIAIIDSQVTLPVTLSDINFIQVGDYYFTPSDLLTAEDGAKVDNLNLDRTGYTLIPAGVITFHPSITGTAIITGEHAITTDYADLANTSFPIEFENLFITGLRMHYYDLAKDGRFSKENTQYQLFMYQMKAADNRRKPRPPYSPRGYTA